MIINVCKSWATDISVLNSMAAVRAVRESVRPGRSSSIPRVTWLLNHIIIDSFLGDISYSFWSRLLQ